MEINIFDLYKYFFSLYEKIKHDYIIDYKFVKEEFKKLSNNDAFDIREFKSLVNLSKNKHIPSIIFKTAEISIVSAIAGLFTSIAFLAAILKLTSVEIMGYSIASFFICIFLAFFIFYDYKRPEKGILSNKKYEFIQICEQLIEEYESIKKLS